MNTPSPPGPDQPGPGVPPGPPSGPPGGPPPGPPPGAPHPGPHPHGQGPPPGPDPYGHGRPPDPSPYGQGRPPGPPGDAPPGPPPPHGRSTGVIVAIVVVLVAQGAEDRSLQVPLLLGEIPPRPVTVAKRPLAFSLGGALAVGTQRDLGLIEAEIGDLDLVGGRGRAQDGMLGVRAHEELSTLDEGHAFGAELRGRRDAGELGWR